MSLLMRKDSGMMFSAVRIITHFVGSRPITNFVKWSTRYEMTAVTPVFKNSNVLIMDAAGIRHPMEQQATGAFTLGLNTFIPFSKKVNYLLIKYRVEALGWSN